jgi:large subunit ribosomal protein L20
MARVKGATTAKKRHSSLLKKTKGYRGRRKSVIRLAKQAVMKAEKYAYISRRTKKRDIRRLWIIRINAACKQNDIKYSRFIKLLIDTKNPINRKQLSQMAEKEPQKFSELVKSVKS